MPIGFKWTDRRSCSAAQVLSRAGLAQILQSSPRAIAWNVQSKNNHRLPATKPEELKPSLLVLGTQIRDPVPFLPWIRDRFFRIPDLRHRISNAYF